MHARQREVVQARECGLVALRHALDQVRERSALHVFGDGRFHGQASGQGIGIEQVQRWIHDVAHCIGCFSVYARQAGPDACIRRAAGCVKQVGLIPCLQETIMNTKPYLVHSLSALSLVALLAACSGMQSAPQQSLYDRLGGKPAIQAVVDDFIGNVAADKRINGFFANTNIPRLNTMLVNQICEATGGPCKYTGRDMKSTHAGMGVSEAHFNALVEDLVKSLDKFNVPAKEENELLAALASMKGDIVGR